MIVNKYTVTKDMYIEWARSEQGRGMQKNISIMWIAVLVILLIATVVFIIVSPKTESAPMWITLEIAFFVFSAYHLLFKRQDSAAVMYRKLAAQLGENWTVTIGFANDAVVVSEADFEVRYPYKEIISVRGGQKEIFIETDSHYIIHVYPDKFVNGDYKQFRRFIESKVVNKCFFT
ncbi:MAG: hypothetical protein IIZ59_01830 [Clostridia bacterium]|nr:hypothetical protein [Clostridia bacterium]